MTEHHELVDKLTRFFRSYYAEDVAQLAQRYPKDQKSISIDYQDVFRYEVDIADDLREQPRQMLNYFEEALELYDLPVDIDFSDAHVRVAGLPDENTFDVSETPRHENIGSLLDVRGQVQKVSAVKCLGVKPRSIRLDSL